MKRASFRFRAAALCLIVCGAASVASIAHADDGDAAIRRLLQGTWTEKTSCSDEQTTFFSDGTFLNHTRNAARKSGWENTYGRFAIQSGHLIVLPLYAIDAETGRRLKTDQGALSLSVREDHASLVLENDAIFGAGDRGTRVAAAHRCPDAGIEPPAPEDLPDQEDLR